MSLTLRAIVIALALPLSTAGAKRITPVLPNVTSSGYLDVEKGLGSAMFYAYYEAQAPPLTRNDTDSAGVPILLWMQGGPGCASSFGNFYELGPQRVTPDLSLEPNPGAWNLQFGLLFIDQPIGTGFSVAGGEQLLSDELQMASDLYTALHAFFEAHPGLQGRPLVVTGESYAGKYVPSLTHFVLQFEVELGLRPDRLLHHRPLPPATLELGPPLFKLLGAAIGNGLTNPQAQVMVHADVCHALGIIDQAQQVVALKLQLEVVQQIAAQQWAAAHQLREQLLRHLAEAGGLATLYDLRRQEPYDAEGAVDRYLNLPEVKAALGVPEDITFESCSSAVGAALGEDVMKSIAHLVPDVLRELPLLLYQGQFDVQDGPASTEEWLSQLEWEGRQQFMAAKRRLWRVVRSEEGNEELQMAPPRAATAAAANLSETLSAAPASSAAAAAAGGPGQQRSRPGAELAGYWKRHDTLSHVVVRDAGHMVPRDQPVATRLMVEQWVRDAHRIGPRDQPTGLHVTSR